jgi:hypothetical protein
MSRLTGKLASKSRKAARKAYDEVETRVLVWQGKKAVDRKVKTAARVGKKAVKTGLLVGALAAAGVVRREVRKLRESH